MKNFPYSFICLLFVGLLIPVSLSAQTTLTAGDIAFIGLNSDGTDNFAFVLLKSIDSGTEIKFTDCGWNDGVGFNCPTGDNGHFTWTAGSAMSAGAIVEIEVGNGSSTPVPNTGSASGSGMLISTIGDQIFAFQGTFGLSADFIAGIHYNYVSGVTNTSNWDGSSSSNSTSALPDALLDGTDAIWVYGSGPTEHDNFEYDCSTTSGTPAVLGAAINDINNWNTSASTTYTLDPFPCSFTVTGLAVDLISFSGQRNEEFIHLQWLSADERDHDYYEIERAILTEPFVPIARISGKGGQVDNHYEYLDPISINSPLRYRLKSVDLSGQFEYSQQVEVAGIEKRWIDIPNLVKSGDPLSVYFSADQQNPVQISIKNMLGQELKSQTLTPGQLQYQIPLQSLSPGTYIINAFGSGHFHSQNLIISP